MAVRALLWSFGGAEQDETGNVTINSKKTIEAVKFMNALFKETRRPRSSRGIRRRTTAASSRASSPSCKRDLGHALGGEGQPRDVEERSSSRPALKGPVRRIAAEHVMDCYAIWNFAENKEGAKQFLIDYIDNFGARVQGERVLQLPLLPVDGSGPQDSRLANDPKAVPHDKYKVLGNVLDWATNVGYPGYATAGIDEVFNTFVAADDVRARPRATR